MSAHEERCGLEAFDAAIQALSAGDEGASEQIFEMLHFDHYLRQMLLEEWDIHPVAMEFLLGRPLSQLLRHVGLEAEMTPEGVFRLGPCVR